MVFVEGVGDVPRLATHLLLFQIPERLGGGGADFAVGVGEEWDEERAGAWVAELKLK